LLLASSVVRTLSLEQRRLLFISQMQQSSVTERNCVNKRARVGNPRCSILVGYRVLTKEQQRLLFILIIIIKISVLFYFFTRLPRKNWKAITGNRGLPTVTEADPRCSILLFSRLPRKSSILLFSRLPRKRKVREKVVFILIIQNKCSNERIDKQSSVTDFYSTFYSVTETE